MFCYVHFSSLSLDFLLKNIHTMAQKISWLFTKYKARVLAYITVRNFVIICNAHNLYDAFYKGFLYDCMFLSCHARVSE